MTDSALEAHRGNIEELTDKWLSAYLANIRTFRQRAFAKELNDPIWGTIRVSPAEVLILDSPLLQRLRHIKQLGVVHYVYPSAVHTRLEHSLGVMTLVEMLCMSINAHWEGDQKPISLAYIELMRIAGLCHDVGHGLMSHVSENGLANVEACEDLRNEFSDSVGRRGRNQLSEIAAYYMLGSPAFLELLRLVDELCPGELQPLDPQEDPGEKLPHWQRSLQRVIISEPTNPSVPLLHELISGPFDADKLDYMSRDARFSGVPAITDIPRLIQKARSVDCAFERLPRPIQQLRAGEAPRYYVTGIARSGARTLDELALGRALMFDKIYRHHKVRACEAMVSSIITELIKVREDTPAMLPYRIDDSQILNLDAQTAAKLMGVEYNRLNDEQLESLRVVEDLAGRLRDRRLLVRAFAFGPKMPGDAYRDDVSQKSGIAKVVRFAKDPARRLALAQAIAQEAAFISRLTGEPDPASIVPGGDLVPYIWIDPPKSALEGETEDTTSHAYLISENGEVRSAGEDYAETHQWSEAYVNTRDLGLIFAPYEVATAVYVAAEAIIRREFHVRVPSTMYPYAKVRASRIESIKAKLTAANYYDDKPRDIRPVPAILNEPDTKFRIESLAASLAGYQGPIESSSVTARAQNYRLRGERIKTWLQQFSSEAKIGSALEMLENVRIVGRAQALQALSGFIEANPGFQGASVCVLGEPKDSSSILTYYANDLHDEWGCRSRQLGDALAVDAPILFVDDYVGTARQSISIFESWLGEPLTYDLGEERTLTLSDPLKAALRERSIGVVFIGSSSVGVNTLDTRLQELGLDATVQAMWSNQDLPYITNSEMFSDKSAGEDLVAELRRLGQELWRQPDGAFHAKAEERALGYGNEGLLLITSYNTPTATVTALWKRSEPGTALPWEALFPRRPKN